MNSYIITPDTRTVTIHEYDAQVNSIYTLFSSILIDSSDSLKQHIIHTDGYATDNSETPFFIGEKLFLGRALVCGLNGHEEVDTTITQEELSQLINYEVNDFYLRSVSALSQAKISINQNFKVSLDDEEDKVQLNYEWVIFTFNMADLRTQSYFLDKLDDVIAKNEDIGSYFQEMARLALQASS